MFKIRKYQFFILLTISMLFSTLVNAESAQNPAEKNGDRAISAMISAKYAVDNDLSPYRITISSNDGVVSLKGNLKTEHQFQKAIHIAKESKGVKNVDTSDLSFTKSNQPEIDSTITIRAKERLIQNKLFEKDKYGEDQLTIETKNGVVYISGTVNNEKYKFYINKIIKTVPGVKSVNDNAIDIEELQDKIDYINKWNSDRLSEKWSELKGYVQQYWSKLTNEDLDKIDGKMQNLIAALKEKYGYSSRSLQREVNVFFRKLKNPDY